MTSVADKWAAVNKKLDKANVDYKPNGRQEVLLSSGLPNLDYISSGSYREGGLKSGRMIEIYGPSSSGKTQIATSFMIEAQRAGGASRFADHEKSFAHPLAERFGLDTTRGPFSYAKPRSLEESIDKAVEWMITVRDADIIDKNAPMCIVFDSIASMVPASKLERSGDGANMREKLALATAMSQELPAFMTFVEENNCLAVFLNQAREKPGVMYGDPTYTPGGKAPEFYASTRIKLGRTMIKAADKKTVVGQKITAETTKNKVYRPFLKTSWYFRFREDGTGYIDVIESMFEHLAERGAIEKADLQNYVWNGGKAKKHMILKQLNADANGLEKLLELSDGLGDMAAEAAAVDIDGDED